MKDTTKALMKQVFDHGFNIYSAINYTKKKLKREIDFPEDVIQKVCNLYLSKPPSDIPKKQYAWFTVSLSQASKEWFAEEEQKKNDHHKKQRVPQLIKDIMRSV